MTDTTAVSTTVCRDRILALQARMLNKPVELRIESPVQHFFSPNMYERRMSIAAGTVIVGKIHRHAHLNNISVGTIQVHSEFGTFTYVGPCQFISDPGTKRVVHALTDTVWATYHANPTDTQDLAELEAAIIAPSYEALDQELLE